MAADPRFPDWPCAQIKVPEISVAAVWSGPSIDDVGTAWETDPSITNLVARVAARRTPLDEAEAAISNFIAGDAVDRRQKAKLLFAGLFATLNQERSQVMNGPRAVFSPASDVRGQDPPRDCRAARAPGCARSGLEQARRAGQPHRLGYAHFRGAAQDHQLRLQGARPARATLVCAGPSDPALDGVTSLSGVRRRLCLLH